MVQTPEILQSANQAYEKATLIRSNESFVTDLNDLVRDMESWEGCVYLILLTTLKYDVRYIGDCRLLKSDNKIIIQEAFTTIIDIKDNKHNSNWNICFNCWKIWKNYGLW